MARKREKILPAVRPNAGIGAEYRARLDRWIDAMTRSYARWILAQYRKKPPRMAMDAVPPADELRKKIENLGRYWELKFEDMAPRLAGWFSKQTFDRTTGALEHILRQGGMSVEFEMTPGMRDVFAATVNENVSLIRSIASEYHSEVEGLVMRSVAAGRDLGDLSKELQRRYGITKRRAATIALDQNNKASSTFGRVGKLEVGIEEEIWMHSHAGKKPRPTHVAMHGKRYKIAEGMYDPDPKVQKRIWPGQLIRCRCIGKPIVKGFS